VTSDGFSSLVVQSSSKCFHPFMEMEVSIKYKSHLQRLRYLNLIDLSYIAPRRIPTDYFEEAKFLWDIVSSVIGF